MRFGIMTMQQDALIPSGLSAGEMLAYLSAFDHADLARQLHSHGFDPIELGGDMALFLPQTMAPPTIERLAALKAQTSLTYTVHLPLWSVEPSTPLMPVREGSVQALIDSIEATRPLEPECYVLHATGPLAAEFYYRALPEMAKAFLLRQFQAHARESLQAILERTGILSRQLAIETVEFPLDLTLELAEELDLSLCLDIGHVLVGYCGPVELFDALEQCLPRLVEIHLHDSIWQGPEARIRHDQDHQALGTGDLDVGRLLDRLAAAGFAGPLVFEVTLAEALASLDVIRALCPEVLAG